MVESGGFTSSDRTGSRQPVGLSPVAQSQTGKWVTRVASTGGGRTYRSRRPMNFYAVIGFIVVLGLLSVMWARHEYQSSGTSPKAIPPLVGTTSYAGLGIDVCGTVQPSLPAGPTSTITPLTLQADGVVKVSPKTASTAGKNANLTLLTNGYPGLKASSNSFTLPASSGTSAVTYTNGEACPKGTPQAGKTGVVTYTYWQSYGSSTPTVTTNPSDVRFTGNSLVTLGFLAQGSKAAQPSTTTRDKMLEAARSGSTTPTTAPAVTVPTTAASTTTTAKK